MPGANKRAAMSHNKTCARPSSYRDKLNLYLFGSGLSMDDTTAITFPDASAPSSGFNLLAAHRRQASMVCAVCPRRTDSRFF